MNPFLGCIATDAHAAARLRGSFHKRKNAIKGVNIRCVAYNITCITYKVYCFIYKMPCLLTGILLRYYVYVNYIALAIDPFLG